MGGGEGDSYSRNKYINFRLVWLIHWFTGRQFYDPLVLNQTSRALSTFFFLVPKGNSLNKRYCVSMY